MYVIFMTIKETNSTSLFSGHYRLEKLSKQRDPLERLNKVVKWEYFRETIEKIYSKKTYGQTVLIQVKNKGK